MAEGEDNTDKSQKTEEPTARKLEEARKRGQVINSKEVSNWLMLFAGTMVVGMAGPGIMHDLQHTLKKYIAHAHQFPADAHGIRMVMTDLFLDVGGILFLPMLV